MCGHTCGGTHVGTTPRGEWIYERGENSLWHFEKKGKKKKVKEKKSERKKK